MISVQPTFDWAASVSLAVFVLMLIFLSVVGSMYFNDFRKSEKGWLKWIVSPLILSASILVFIFAVFTTVFFLTNPTSLVFKNSDIVSAIEKKYDVRVSSIEGDIKNNLFMTVEVEESSGKSYPCTVSYDGGSAESLGFFCGSGLADGYPPLRR